MKEDLEHFDRRMGHERYEVKIPVNRITDWWEKLNGRGSEAAHTGPQKDEIDRAIDEAINEANRT